MTPYLPPHSGGAVASPQLLQLSGVGDPEVLSRAGVKLVHSLPAVGRNLHNHVAHFLNFQVNDNNTTPLNWATAMEYLLFRDGLMSGTGKCCQLLQCFEDFQVVF